MNRYIKELLSLNNTYDGWGNGRDYMAKPDGSWDSSLCYMGFQDYFDEFGFPDDLNEIVNFYFFIEENNCLCLQLWYILPRKGASRGVLIKNIQEDDVKEIYEILHEAVSRFSIKFEKLVKITNKAGVQ